MIEVTYRTHFTKPVDHIVYGIPPCTDISQELQRLDFNDSLTIFEPMFSIAVLNDIIKSFSSCPRHPDSSDNSVTKCDWVTCNCIGIGLVDVHKRGWLPIFWDVFQHLGQPFNYTS